MDYERRKELLTKENIKSDLKGLLYHDIRMMIFQVLSLLFLFVVVRAIFKLEFKSTIVPDCIFGAIFIGYFIGFIEIIILIVKVNQNKFSILTDKLVETIEGRPYAGKWTWYKPHVLCFTTYGKYNIPIGRNYKWSEFYHLNATEVLHSSHVGETFMIVRFRKEKKIAMVYNTRMFELAE